MTRYITPLILLAVARAWGSFDTDNLLTYVLVDGLGAMLAGLLVLEQYMRRLSPGFDATARPPRPRRSPTR